MLKAYIVLICIINVYYGRSGIRIGIIICIEIVGTHVFKLRKENFIGNLNIKLSRHDLLLYSNLRLLWNQRFL